MSSASPLDVARDFCAGFGPTYEDAVATCRKLVHPDVSWQSVTSNDHPVESLAALLDDLRRARETMGAEGFGIDVHRVRADGDLVVMRRTDTISDAEGNPLHVLDLMSMLRVVDGKIVWSRECFLDSRTSDEAWGG
ncbi:nuclear transport factor 2 family protein [Actinacidiphila glaucinigra]|uniref:Limonene-1,2-epoxide hydrolase n=1 Tax=Actinacidiphila glaucinigra TaxID=235986 RepID=A0A239P2A0_9ACTN|nr:nuclear transport factor 2 family protein [Actinacidiphila glaucinigra]SNT60469.1 Limonene-1,2-epoxide hydrolase [Actinacidiphila glaucinigra]